MNVSRSLNVTCSRKQKAKISEKQTRLTRDKIRFDRSHNAEPFGGDESIRTASIASLPTGEVRDKASVQRTESLPQISSDYCIRRSNKDSIRKRSSIGSQASASNQSECR